MPGVWTGGTPTPGTPEGITYNQGGAGAINRTLQSWLEERISVKDFGAVGDGVADDYAAITAAIAALPIGTSTTYGGGTIYFPGGKYKCSSSITHPERVTLKGDGRFSSIINYTGNAVAITTPVSGNRFMLEDLCIRGNDGTGLIGYRIQGSCTNLETKNVRIEKFTTCGYNLTGTANNITIINPEVTNCGDAGVDLSGGILANGNANAVSILGGSIASNNGWGIRSTTYTKDWKVYTDIEGNTLGGIRGAGFSGLDIKSYFENTGANTYQIRLEGLGGVPNYGVTVRGCNLGASAVGFDIMAMEFVDGLIVEGNHIRSCRRMLDISGGTVTNYRVENNTPITNASSGLVYNGVDDRTAQVITDIAKTQNAGTGDGFFVLGGILGRSITAVGTDADTNQKVLQSIPLPRNTLTVNGQMLRITAWGTTAANGNTKTLRLKIGGTSGPTQAQASGAYNSQNWRMEVLIIRTGVASEESAGNIFVGATVASTDVTTGSAISLTADTTIDVTGENGAASANDIVCEGCLVEFLP